MTIEMAQEERDRVLLYLEERSKYHERKHEGEAAAIIDEIRSDLECGLHYDEGEDPLASDADENFETDSSSPESGDSDSESSESEDDDVSETRMLRIEQSQRDFDARLSQAMTRISFVESKTGPLVDQFFRFKAELEKEGGPALRRSHDLLSQNFAELKVSFNGVQNAVRALQTAHSESRFAGMIDSLKKHFDAKLAELSSRLDSAPDQVAQKMHEDIRTAARTSTPNKIPEW